MGIKGNVDPAAPVHSCRIRVGRSIDGFGLSPGITKEQRVGVENLMKKAFANLKGDLAGTYHPLTGMDEKVRQQLVDDHFLFVSDPNLKIAGMERDWPEGRGIFHNKDKTFPSGSTRRINSVSSPCRWEEMSGLSLIALPVASRLSKTVSRPSLERTSCSTPSTDTSTPAPPTWEPA